MPRAARPWFRRQTGWWMAQVNRKQVKLCEGPKSKETRRLAKEKLKAILKVQVAVSPPRGRHTVASLVDLYLTHMKPVLSNDTYYERRYYLQLFAEHCGWKMVNDDECKPIDLSSWILENKQWVSDWTKA